MLLFRFAHGKGIFGELHRLTGVETVTDTTSHIAYTYDLAGNRTALWNNGQMVAQQRSNAAHQVVGWTYDAAGNLLSDGTGTYTYDALNRLVQHTDTASTYNGEGILVQAGDTRYDGATRRRCLVAPGEPYAPDLPPAFSSPRRPVASSPRRLVAPSPRRPVASSPRRLVAPSCRRIPNSPIFH